MKITKSNCCTAITNAKKTKKSALGDGASFFTTLLLILVPKCPFCVMAYTGSLLMFFDVKSTAIVPYVVHFKPVLGGLVILVLALNFKGMKTWISLSLATVALVFIMLSSYANLVFLPDWVLYCVFLFAAWHNGNFQYFYRFLRKRNTWVRQNVGS